MLSNQPLNILQPSKLFPSQSINRRGHTSLFYRVMGSRTTPPRFAAHPLYQNHIESMRIMRNWIDNFRCPVLCFTSCFRTIKRNQCGAFHQVSGNSTLKPVILRLDRRIQHSTSSFSDLIGESSCFFPCIPCKNLNATGQDSYSC